MVTSTERWSTIWAQARPRAKGIIQGKKFDDLNDNGKPDRGEPGLAGWDIYHDANNNGVRDSGEVTDVTDSSNYELKDFPAGLQYIREVQKSGWK